MNRKIFYVMIVVAFAASAILSARMYPSARIHAEISSKDALVTLLTSGHISRSSYYIVERLIEKIGQAGEKERLVDIGVYFAKRGVDPGGVMELLGGILPKITNIKDRERVALWISDYTFKVSKALTGKGMDPSQALGALGEIIPRLVSPRERNYVMRLGMSMAEKGIYPGSALKAIGKILPLTDGKIERNTIFMIGINLAREGIDPTGVLEAFRIAFPNYATSEKRIEFAKEVAGYMQKIAGTLKDKGIDSEYALIVLGKILPGTTSAQERILLTQELVTYFVNIPSEVSKRGNTMKMIARIFPELKSSNEREQVISLCVVLSKDQINPAPVLNAMQGVLRHYNNTEDRQGVIRLGAILAESGINPANTYDLLFIQLESSKPDQRSMILEMFLSIAAGGEDPAIQLRFKKI